MKRLLFIMIALVGLFGYSHAQNCSASFVPGTNPNSLTVNFVDSSYVTNGGTVLHWNWHFGDGDSSDLQNPAHTYATAGWYYTCLTIYSNTASVPCTSTHCDSIYVGGTPPSCQAYFYDSVLLTPAQPGATVAFYNYSPNVNNYTTYLWDFGDASTSTLENPTHTYAASGSYQACLTITKHDSAGNTLCSNTYCRNVTVTLQNANCGVGFQYTNTVGSSNANFYATATGYNVSYSWSFGDGTSGTGANPYHIYSHAGSYYVCVSIESHDSITGGVDCRSSFCDTVHVGSAATTCQAYFYDSLVAVSATGALVDFYNYSPNVNNYTTYQWSFGDGHSATSANPIHTYTASGTYTACLTITKHDSAGNVLCDDQYCSSITIALPTAGTCSASYQYSVNPSNNQVTFYGTSTGADPTYSWTIDNFLTLQGSTVLYTLQSGYHIVCLTVEAHDSLGSVYCTATHCDSVYVPGTPPSCHAGFTTTPTVANPLALEFTNTSTGVSNNTFYWWEFGDGDSTMDANPHHTYAAAGTYTVCLYITTYDSLQNITCQDQVCTSVTVGSSNTNCHASFTYVGTNTSNTVLHFINNSVGASAANTTAYTWSFGDSTYSHLFDPTHGFPSPGTYYVCLNMVTYANGAVACSDDYCLTVTVQGAPPVACHAAYQYTATSNPLELHFQEYATGSNLSYAWDFGDGHTATTHDPVHTFAAAGYYNVCLTVTHDSAGAVLCSDTYCDSIVVGSPTGHCSASFHYIAGSATNSNTYHFINDGTVSANTGATYLWTFGDGDSSTNFDPNHTYAHAGGYVVCLTVNEITATGAITCSSMFCDSVVVGANTNPTGPFSIEGTVYRGYSNVAPNSIVYLITLDSFDLVAVDSVQAPQGHYVFNNVSGGQYLVKAALLPGATSYHDYLPTYYGDSLFWLDASLLTVNQNIASVDIHLIQGNNPGGPGFVGGNIFQGANKAASPGDPQGGLLVMVLNMDNTPVAYTYSGADGSYSFSGLAYGTYKIYTEVLSKQTLPAIVTISASSEVNEGVNIIVDEDMVYSSRITGIEQPGSDITNASVFPNPVSNMAILRFNVSKEDALNLTLTNMLGQQVMNNKLNVVAGTNDIQLDLNGYAPGVYILSVKDSNNKGEIFRIVKQ